MRRTVSTIVALVWAGAAWAQEPAATPPAGDQVKSMSGMAVLGNNEAPKALVIVPWKSSQIGDGIGVVDSLSNRPMPVDRDVFSRELHYYEIRTGDSAGSGDSDANSLAVGSR
jgi:hypothetical protein